MRGRMDSVRTAGRGIRRVLHRSRAPHRAPACPAAVIVFSGVPVLDVVFIVATLALFALVALVAKGVERL